MPLRRRASPELVRSLREYMENLRRYPVWEKKLSEWRWLRYYFPWRN
jgi:hypothetical protein